MVDGNIENKDETSSNYITLDFGEKRCEIDKKDAENKVIMPPLRIHQKHNNRHHQQPKSPSISASTNQQSPIINHHHLQIHHQPKMRDNFISNLNSNQHEPDQPEAPHEDPRDFATFLCIFASVMTTVLVLMFYMVGEAAFRLILMVISFVSILTLCLACFLRRPTLVILGQTVGSNCSSSSTLNKNNNDTKLQQSSQPYLLIFPTLFGHNSHTRPHSTVEHLAAH